MTSSGFPQTLAAQSAALAEGQFSSVELTRHYLERINRLDGEFNSFITVCPDFALAQAIEADRRRIAGENGPLLGIPYANKDIFCTKGIKTTCASRMLADWQAPYDATVVERLHAAGMVMLGKTNMDEFARGSSNETSWFGPARNPWDS
jgi:aspartyl-tRNA(Asn)/glutamyl-tRNA(Gln) amidotransferase subunit A